MPLQPNLDPIVPNCYGEERRWYSKPRLSRHLTNNCASRTNDSPLIPYCSSRRSDSPLKPPRRGEPK